MATKLISSRRLVALTAIAMIAFAGNSVFTRLALKATNIDPASFTTIRLMSGTIILQILIRTKIYSKETLSSVISGLCLFVYAAGFSFAYTELSAGTGALLLFGAVQLTMISYGFWSGERFSKLQSVGLLVAFAGLIILVSPGISAPSSTGSVLMACAGIAWGVYSIRGRGAVDPLAVTAGNFLRSVPFTIVLSIVMVRHATLDFPGVLYAIVAGALASGLGYVLWYLILPLIRTTRAATVQLSVPVIAALGGVAFLGEPISFRLVLASIAVLGGIALVIAIPHKRKPSQPGNA